MVRLCVTHTMYVIAEEYQFSVLGNSKVMVLLETGRDSELVSSLRNCSLLADSNSRKHYAGLLTFLMAEKKEKFHFSCTKPIFDTHRLEWP